MGRTISVCDREADVYEYLSYKTGHQERFVIRASWDRGVEVEDGAGERGRLFPVVEAARQHGRLTVDVAQRGGRAARRAEVTLRTTRVWLRRPSTGRSELPARLGVNVVVAREEQPPVGVEPLEWVLLTSEPIDTGEQVVDVVRLYRLRWRIEDFHKAWKSGAGVERSRLQSADNLQRLAVILAFVAVRLLQLRDLQQAEPDAPCDRQLNATEWRVLWAVIEKTPPPSKVPSARWAYRAIGRLGGWHDTKHTGRVGWAAYWDGWHQLEFHITGYHAALLLQGLEK